MGTAMLLASCAPSLDTTRVPMSSSVSSNHSSMVDKLERSITRYRRSLGKPAIPRNPGLDHLAQQHCLFMAKNRGKFTLGSENISHYGFEGRVLAAKRLYGMENIAENLAGGIIRGDIPEQLVSAWVDSKEHHYNLKQDWSATGIGVHVADDGMVYATQIFATQRNSQMEMRELFRQF